MGDFAGFIKIALRNTLNLVQQHLDYMKKAPLKKQITLKINMDSHPVLARVLKWAKRIELSNSSSILHAI